MTYRDRSALKNGAKKVFLLLMLILIGSFLYGCAQSPVAGTQNLTTTPITSFMGVSIGMTELQATGIKGTPDERIVDSTDPGIVTLEYDIKDDGRDSWIILSGNSVTEIGTDLGGYTVDDFGVGDSVSAIKAIIGEPSKIAAYTIGNGGYFYYYGDLNLRIGFTTSDIAKSITVSPNIKTLY